MLKWSQQDLAIASGVSLPTIKRMEAREGPIRGITSNLWNVERALEDAGVEFTDEEAPGVRLRGRSIDGRET